VNPRMVELMQQSIAANGLTDKVSATVHDLRDMKSFCPTESVDLVVANPLTVTAARNGLSARRPVTKKPPRCTIFLRRRRMRYAAGGVLPWCSCRNVSAKLSSWR
jgi:tRNA G37 N-methylase Trm5